MEHEKITVLCVWPQHFEQLSCAYVQYRADTTKQFQIKFLLFNTEHICIHITNLHSPQHSPTSHSYINMFK